VLENLPLSFPGMKRKKEERETAVSEAVQSHNLDQAIEILDHDDLFAEVPDKLDILQMKFDLVASDEYKAKVLDQKFDLVASDEDRIKVLDQKLRLAASDEDKATVLDQKLEVLRNMGEGEAALNTKIETIAKLIPHATPEVQNKLKEESARATAALNAAHPTYDDSESRPSRGSGLFPFAHFVERAWRGNENAPLPELWSNLPDWREPGSAFVSIANEGGCSPLSRSGMYFSDRRACPQDH